MMVTRIIVAALAALLCLREGMGFTGLRRTLGQITGEVERRSMEPMYMVERAGAVTRGRQSYVRLLSSVSTPATMTMHEIFMPALSSTMEEGKIVEWRKAEGDRVDKGDIVMIVESDKADMEVESFEEGFLAKLLIPAGGTARVGETVALIAESESDIESVRAGKAEIPSGDNSRHDGTTIVKIPPSASSQSASQEVPAEFLDEATISDVQASEIFMPALSSTMTEGKISRWLKQEGDPVEVGDIVMVVESDKADMDVESFSSGILAKILVPEGSMARVGETCALIADSSERVEAVRQAGVQGVASGAGSRHDGTTAVRAESSVAVADTLSDAQQSPSQVVLTGDSHEIFMPALSSTMTEGKVTQWIKKKGDKVNRGDTIMVVESDKADMEVESFEEGYLSEIMVHEGESAGVGATVAVLVQNEKDIGKSVKLAQSSSARPSAPPAERTSAAPKISGSAVGSDGRVFFEADPQVSSFVPSSSLDQDPSSQIPADFTPERLTEAFMEVLQSTEGGRALLADMQSSSVGGKQLENLLKRQHIRAPPHSMLLRPEKARKGSFYEASERLRKLADKLQVDINSLVGTGTSQRITEEDIRRAASGQASPSSTASSSASPSKKAGSWTPQQGVTNAGPSARQFAKDKKVDLHRLAGKGSGPFGRIEVDDIRAFLGLPILSESAGSRQRELTPSPQSGSSAALNQAPVAKTQPASAQFSVAGQLPQGVEVLNAMQKAVAANMVATKDVPIFRVSRSICTDAFDNLYKEIKGKGVTMSSLLAKAVGIALEKNPVMNSWYDPSEKGGAIRHPGRINIATAVAIDGGLLTPVLQDVQRRDVFDLSRDWKDLVDRAREKKLKPDEYSSGTFYISNLGMMGVTQMDPILPPKAGAIMGVGASIPRVVVQPRNGLVGAVKEMVVTLTCDHRHIYGADAAKFLQDLADVIENQPDLTLKR